VHVVRCATPQTFLERARTFLAEQEACHNVLLGVPAALAASPGPQTDAYFAVIVDDAGAVAGAAMMTPPHKVALSQMTRDGAVDLLIQDIRRWPSAPPGVHAPEPLCTRVAAAWTRVTGQRCERLLRARMYQLELVRAPVGVPGRLRAATAADRPILVAWIRAFAEEALGDRTAEEAAETVTRRLREPTGGFVLWEDDGPRTLAGYSGPTPHGIRVGPVYTPPAHRRRGYGSACVAGLSQSLLDRGYRFCFLLADAANPAANLIYQRIGYEPVCDVGEYRFLT